MTTNPYQTPEGQLTTDDHAVGEIKFFSPSSRINRLRYWAHSMLFALGMFGVFLVIGLVASFVSLTVGIVLGVIAYIAVLVFSFILIIQRLHDLNKTGWMSLLAIIPLANIYLFVLLIFFKGTEGRNNYGLQTPPNKPWHWVLALSFPVLMFVIGILAAVAIPAYQSYVERAQGVDSSYNSQDSTYPPEYTEDGAIEDSTFSDEVIEENNSYESTEEDILEDEVIDAIEEEAEDTGLDDADSDTPQ